MSTARTVLVGGGGFCRELIWWAADCVAAQTLAPVGGYLDDAGHVMAPHGYDVPYLGTLRDYSPRPGDGFVLALGNPGHKRSAFDQLASRGGSFPRFIHPTARVAPTASIDQGAVLLLMAVAGPESRIGQFVALNGGSGVGHDGSVGEFTTISSHVDVTGGASIGKDVFVGSKALFMPGVKVGDGAKVGAGSIVYRSVPAGATVFAAPAKLLKMKAAPVRPSAAAPDHG
jgi:sugar O-acyltransferase (sialic acid O-acetyltransferase NeuD family)